MSPQLLYSTILILHKFSSYTRVPSRYYTTRTISSLSQVMLQHCSVDFILITNAFSYTWSLTPYDLLPEVSCASSSAFLDSTRSVYKLYPITSHVDLDRFTSLLTATSHKT